MAPIIKENMDTYFSYLYFSMETYFVGLMQGGHTFLAIKFPDFSLIWFDFPWLKTLILSQWPLLLEGIYWFKCCQNIQQTSTPPNKYSTFK